MDNFNVTATLTSQISIQEKFNSTSTITSWVLSAYALTLGSCILIFGKLSDILGPHNIFILGLTTIWLCSLITAVINDSIIALIVFRAFQGVGASALIPSGFALTANYYSYNQRHLQLAISGLICALTASFGIGTIIGGSFALTSIGYKSLFYFVFGITFVFDLILVFIIIPIEKTAEHENLKVSNLDFPGVFLFIVGILLMILGLTEGGENWKSPKAYVPLPIGFILVLNVFIFESYYIRNYQIKTKSNGIQPDSLNKFNKWKFKLDLLFPPECLKIPNFLTFLISVGLYYMTFTICITGQIQYHLFVENNSTIITAIKILPLSIGLVLSAVSYNKKIYDKIGTRFVLLFSSALTLGSYIWMSRLKYSSYKGYWKFEFFSIFLFGFGTNIFFNVYLNVVLSNTPLHLQGVISGIYQTFCQVSLCIANAIVASLLGSLHFATDIKDMEDMHSRFNNIHYLGIGCMATALIILLLFTKNTSNGKIDNEGENDLLLNNISGVPRNDLESDKSVSMYNV